MYEEAMALIQQHAWCADTPSKSPRFALRLSKCSPLFCNPSYMQSKSGLEPEAPCPSWHRQVLARKTHPGVWQSQEALSHENNHLYKVKVICFCFNVRLSSLYSKAQAQPPWDTLHPVWVNGPWLCPLSKASSFIFRSVLGIVPLTLKSTF